MPHRMTAFTATHSHQLEQESRHPAACLQQILDHAHRTVRGPLQGHLAESGASPLPLCRCRFIIL